MNQLPVKPSQGPSGSAFLSIYLNDHLAGATSGVELARRAADAEQGTETGEQLKDLASEITNDRTALIRIMRALGVTPRHHFSALGWIAERAGRLKANGRLIHRSPLSTLIGIETLRLGVLGKQQLWNALAATWADDPRIDTDRLAELERRAEQQATDLEQLRLLAATVLVPTDD